MNKEQKLLQRVNQFVNCDKQDLAIMLAQIENRLPVIGQALAKHDSNIAECAMVAVLQSSLERLA